VCVFKFSTSVQTIAKSQEKIDLGSTLKTQIEALMIARNNVDQELIRAKMDEARQWLNQKKDSHELTVSMPIQATQAVVAPEDEINLLQCLPFCRPPYIRPLFQIVGVASESIWASLVCVSFFFFFQGPLLQR